MGRFGKDNRQNRVVSSTINFRVKPHGLFIGTVIQLQYNPTNEIKGLYVQKLNIDIKLQGIEVSTE